MSFSMPEQHRNSREELRLYGVHGGKRAGVFFVDSKGGRVLNCIASSGLGWEHVSVSCWQGRKGRTPTWQEMCRVKALFWDAEDCVVQYHPPESEYVNNAEALHLWRPAADVDLPRPHHALVGVLA